MTFSASPLRFDILRVSLPPSDVWAAQDCLDWRGFSANRTQVECGMCPIADLPAADELELLLPACRVSVHTLELPERAGRHLDALVRQALEDRLLGDRADVLAVPGAARGTERCVWVCSRRWLEGALERLAAVGRSVDRLIPEYVLLPEEAEDTDAVLCATATGGTVFRTVAGRFGIVGNDAVLEQLTDGGVLRRIEDIAGRPCPPCYQGGLPQALARFASRRLDLGPLRRAGALLAVSALLALLGSVVHWRQLENRATHLQHEIRQTFAAAYPGTPIVDPILQWESKHRESLQVRDDALDTAVRVAARLNLPIRPRGIEVGEGSVHLTLTDSDAAQFKLQLEALGKPERRPAGPGFTQLAYRVGREQR